MIINFLVPDYAINQNLKTKKLIYELRKAQYAVWMLSDKNWLTDEVLFSLLIGRLKCGLNVEIVMHNYVLSEYENAKLRIFIDAGGEIFLIDNEKLPKPLKEHYFIVDYSTVVATETNVEHKLKPHRGANYLRENSETLLEAYIENYLNIKNTCCTNRY